MDHERAPETASGAVIEGRSEFTPGPWATNVARLSDGTILVAHVVGPQGQSLAQVSSYSEDLTLANLALIAAAPDLFDVVHDLWAYAADAEDIHLRSLAERARDALIKAGDRREVARAAKHRTAMTAPSDIKNSTPS